MRKVRNFMKKLFVIDDVEWIKGKYRNIIRNVIFSLTKIKYVYIFD